MIAHLCCPGPSLAEYPLGITCPDLVVAVNRAIELVPATWWCFGDESEPWPRRVAFPERLRHVFTPVVRWQMGPPPARELLPWYHPGIIQTRWGEVHAPRPGGQWQTSGPAALGLCLHLGATEVHAWGMDMDGDCDFVGTIDRNPAGHPTRNPERWRNEWQVIHALLDQHPAATLTRHLTGGRMQTHLANRTTTAPRRGRPSIGELQTRPAPQPASTDASGRYTCQHCGKPTLTVSGKPRSDGATPMRCIFCGTTYALLPARLEKLRA
jgi:hypothetical protein